MHATAWSRGLEVTGGGTGVVSHAGLACAVADGARVISGFRVMGDQAEAFGQVASVQVAGRQLAGITCIRLDATVVFAHSGKEQAEPDFRGSGHHLILAECDNVREPLAWMMRPGSAGSNTAASHLKLLDEAIAALPPIFRRELMVTCDGAGASHVLVKRPGKLASRHGYQLTCSVGWALTGREKTALALVPETAWEGAAGAKGEVRERRFEVACGNERCGHRACWTGEAHVTGLTRLLREGPDGARLRAWPKTMRSSVFARRERPHPGAQLTLFETRDGWRCTLHAANLPEDTRGWRGQCACTGAAHRVRARAGDVIRTGKDTGPGHFPSRDYGLNEAWLDAPVTARILLSWLRHLALDGKLAKAEPKTLRYMLFRTAARLVRGGRRKSLKIAAAWPWAAAIITAWNRIQALPHPTCPAKPVPATKEGAHRGSWNPRPPARQPGHQRAPAAKNRPRRRSSRRSGRRLSSVKDRGLIPFLSG